MKIPDDPFGIKVLVGGGVELAKARWLPVLAAKGEARAALIRTKGEFEVRKLDNQYRVIEKAEEKLTERGVVPNPVNEDVLYSILEESGRTSNADLHELWSELLTASATELADSDKILTCISILRQISPFDATQIRKLVQFIPESDKEIDVISYWLNTGWNGAGVENETEFGEISCQVTVHIGNGIDESFNSKKPFGDWDEYAQFILVLRNLERIGLVTRLKKQQFPLNVLFEQFNFTMIGRLFLNGVGLLPSQYIYFSDIEFLDSLS